MSSSTAASAETGKRKLSVLVLSAIGVVYGDIGTSPLYALKECFSEKHGIPLSVDTVFGILSLLFWAILIVVSIKYVIFIMRADNNGEGGIFALMALALRGVESERSRWWITGLGMFGAALFYGDGMITPAISVLSAVEGLEVATPWFDPYVLPITLAIIVALFSFQRFGTAVIGKLFGPINCLWLAVLAVLGVWHISQAPEILAAVNPYYALSFLTTHRFQAFIVLGAVFLAVTGAEALYADMGHFGAKAIRVAWFWFVMPALLLNYFGQGAMILQAPESIRNPFYMMVPKWGIIPLVVLATCATIIASQALITGAYSLTRQAILMGYCPRMKIVHTSEQEIGQIYIPAINWMLLASIILLILGFRSSESLASAYGIAVTATMVITTLLAYIVMRRVWRWSAILVFIGVAGFLTVDLTFFMANAIKVAEGGWFPLLIGVAVFSALSTWKLGRSILSQRLMRDAIADRDFIGSIDLMHPHQIDGTAIFMTAQSSGIPLALLHNLKHNKSLHRRNVFLTIKVEDVPYVPEDQRLAIENLGKGFLRIVVSYGFKDDPDIRDIFRLCDSRHSIAFNMFETSFFLTHETLVPGKIPVMAAWRRKLFAFMSINAARPTDFFNIPSNRAVELGAAVEL
jgi:KUP system potassium uptake protein